MDPASRAGGYRFRLTDDYVGTKGEPFIALNEIGIVFAESPEVIEALDSFQSDCRKDQLTQLCGGFLLR